MPDAREGRPVASNQAASNLVATNDTESLVARSRMTAEVAAMSESDARRITGRIRTVAGMVAESIEKLSGLIREAEQGQAHVALGYRSWTEYVEQEFAGLLPKLPRDVRREFVGEIAQTGLPTRAIAAVVDVSHMTVARDLAAVTNVTTADVEIVDAEIVEGVEDDFFTNEQFETALADAKAGDDLCREKAARKQITGRDGKTYTAQVPRAPRRRPLPEAYRDTSYALLKSAQSLSRLHQDDRFTANREAVRHHGNQLARVANELDDLLNDLGIDRHKYGRAL